MIEWIRHDSKWVLAEMHPGVARDEAQVRETFTMWIVDMLVEFYMLCDKPRLEDMGPDDFQKQDIFVEPVLNVSSKPIVRYGDRFSKRHRLPRTFCLYLVDDKWLKLDSNDVWDDAKKRALDIKRAESRSE